MYNTQIMKSYQTLNTSINNGGILFEFNITRLERDLSRASSTIL